VSAFVNGEDSGERPPGRRVFRPTLMILIASAILGFLLLLIFAGTMPSPAGMVGVALVVLAVFWAVRDHLPAILLVFASVLFVTVVITEPAPRFRNESSSTVTSADDLAKRWAQAGTFDTRLPVVVHLIFDELMSPGAMPDDAPGGPETRQAVREFGQRHSMRVFDSVYSRFFFSGNSIPNLMDAEYLGKTKLKDLAESVTGGKDNAYFDDMAARGYRTVVFQTALLNFCGNRNVDLCETFDSFNPGGRGEVGLDPRNQRASVWQTVVRSYKPSYTSDIGQALLARVYGLKGADVGVVGAGDRYDVQRFPEWFDRFTEFATTVPRGTHIFAHFMAPHSPYLLTENCVVSGRFEAGYYLSSAPPEQRDAKRREHYANYLAQFRCVQRKLDDFLSAVEESENLRDATIIVHGDHGSRISTSNILEKLIQRDFVDNFGTFFAVRAPGVQPGVDCEFLSLPEVFRRYASGRDKVPLRSGELLPVFVMSHDAGDKRVEVPMVPFGCATQNLAP
jgi:hypothetical protein